MFFSLVSFTIKGKCLRPVWNQGGGDEDEPGKIYSAEAGERKRELASQGDTFVFVLDMMQRGV
jgi:hypothetical protein